ncbi:MAG TPA: hypothetical protein PKD09_18215 [Aggregatilinea sp.]|uniref:hypothetical protein n=1 Tax=Aggregatilinea sp. TaxID=2806333 RepID=UPI002B63728A|nr:hypothetical protein [Aggregatilinea sp.]HML23598.1 hypothetical protein [Aggregatilinea sp.]
MPTEAGDSNPWVQQITDVIAESEKVREGLHDDEAMPLIDWGTAQAKTLGARLAAPDTPPPSAEQAAETGYALARLMTRINWVVTYRAKKDADWLTRTFHKINDLSRELHGPYAPTFSDDEIAAWIAAQPSQSNGELLQGLMTRLTPGGATPSGSTDVPGQPEMSAAPDAPAAPDTPDPSGTPDTSDSPDAPGSTPSAPPPAPGFLPGRGDTHEQESID